MQSWQSLLYDTQKATIKIQTMKSRAEAIRVQLAESQRVVELKDDVEKVIEHLQDVMYRQHISMIESLLTKFVESVLKDFSREVVLQLEIDQMQPTLHIMLKNGEDEEDVWNGNGGAITNVLSTGLRLVTMHKLIESGYDIRPFMVFDEVDNWVSQENTLDFYRTLIALSKYLKIQSVIVTHRDISSLYDSSIQVIQLSGDPRDVKGVQVEVLKQHQAQAEEYIRSVQLENYRGYVRQTFELSPMCTIVQGPNNIGKSAFIEAIRATAGIGYSKESIIRHGKKESCVTIDTGSYILEWRRRRKSSPVSVYILKSQDGVVIKDSKSHQGRRAPEWVGSRDVLGVKEVDGADVQIMHQKSNIFLLDDVEGKKAQLLTIGSEAKWIDSIQKVWKSWYSEHRSNISTLRDAFKSIQEKLNFIDPRYKEWENVVVEGIEGLGKAEASLKQLQSIHERLALHAQWKKKAAVKVPTLIKGPIDLHSWLPVMGKTQQLHKYQAVQDCRVPSLQERWNISSLPFPSVEKWHGLHRISKTHVPVLEATWKLRSLPVELISQWSHHYAVHKVPTPKLHATWSTHEWTQTCRMAMEFLQKMESLQSSEVALQNAEKQWKNVCEQQAELKGSWKQCPVCGSSMSEGVDTCST